MAKVGRKKGSTPWNKGLKTGLIPRTAFKKGHIPYHTGTKGIKPPPKTAFKKGQLKSENWYKVMVGRIPWNKGEDNRPLCKVCGDKLKHYHSSKWCRNCFGTHFKAWKGGVTSKNKLERAKFRINFQKKVFARDNYTCQLCNQRGGYLQVDHIQKWSKYSIIRFSMDNCRTLCMSCHYLVTYNKSMPKNIKTWGHNFKQLERSVI